MNYNDKKNIQIKQYSNMYNWAKNDEFFDKFVLYIRWQFYMHMV
jgi:ribosomal protein L19E